nr:hypothetical protein CFP56_11497 [Quercus suber]
MRHERSHWPGYEAFRASRSLHKPIPTDFNQEEKSMCNLLHHTSSIKANLTSITNVRYDGLDSQETALETQYEACGRNNCHVWRESVAAVVTDTISVMMSSTTRTQLRDGGPDRTFQWSACQGPLNRLPNGHHEYRDSQDGNRYSDQQPSITAQACSDAPSGFSWRTGTRNFVATAMMRRLTIVRSKVESRSNVYQIMMNRLISGTRHDTVQASQKLAAQFFKHEREIFAPINLRAPAHNLRHDATSNMLLSSTAFFATKRRT